ncbi:lyase family protein [Streptomyces sp. Da 82-17]|uniref:lyase family protein n=1 Tax=Streptomyces sp. Da 82-17 TaxID=3377116 RepID=UPI0038D3735F
MTYEQDAADGLDLGLLAPGRAAAPTELATGDRQFLQAMLDAEAALTRAQAELGLAPGRAADAVTDAARAERFDVRALAVRARAGGNPVIPLVADLTATVPEDAREYVHRGATSQDILDTAAMLVASRAIDLILPELDHAATELARLAAAHRDTPMPGRTLTQHAVPTTFGLKAAGWRALILDARDRLTAVRDALPAQLGGAAGTLAAFGAFPGPAEGPGPAVSGGVPGPGGVGEESGAVGSGAGSPPAGPSAPSDSAGPGDEPGPGGTGGGLSLGSPGDELSSGGPGGVPSGAGPDSTLSSGGPGGVPGVGCVAPGAAASGGESGFGGPSLGGRERVAPAESQGMAGPGGGASLGGAGVSSGEGPESAAPSGEPGSGRPGGEPRSPLPGGTPVLRLPSAYACQLALAAPELPWHTLRTPVADLAGVLAFAAGALGKFAGDVLVLSRTEIGEVAEGGGGGSSAMPHKANPVRATLIAAAARRAPGLAATLYGSVAAEDERPAGAWHAEWEPLRDLLRTVGGAARDAAELAAGLRVFPDRMRAHLDLTDGLIVSERLAAALAVPLGRARAKQLLSEAAADGLAGEASWPELLRAEGLDEATIAALDLPALTDPTRYTGAAAALTDRALRRR